MKQDDGPAPAPPAGGARPAAASSSAAADDEIALSRHPQGPVVWLALGALGVVYGDIGTSPLYALRECFHGASSVAPTPENVLGILSLVFWSLMVVISGKYLSFVMRADNQGEGGIMALLALVTPRGTTMDLPRTALVLLGLFGAALLYGDGVITPAISVLSAVEGLGLITHRFEPFILPIAIGILLMVFAAQKRGTAGLGAIFGPVMLLWFFTIGGLGVVAILTQHSQHTSVLWAVNPLHALHFFAAHGWHGFLVLGSVVLAITGGEALYADMGHFGRRPIRIAWYAVALPALLLNYFGQGALLLTAGDRVVHPFFELAPSWALLPLVGLSTAATIIASQALISGSFSLTQQAVQLGYAPRLTIVHTSGTAEGQIYGDVCLSGADLSELQQSRRRIWHRRHRHDVGDDLSLLCRRARTLALVVLARRRDRRRLLAVRPVVPCLESGEDR